MRAAAVGDLPVTRHRRIGTEGGSGMTEPDAAPPGPGSQPGPGFQPVDAGDESWWWQPADEVGVALDRALPRFASRRAAEDWLGDHFAELAEAGVAAVSLFDGERAVYGPMPLAP
jgi:hypothetical protein